MIPDLLVGVGIWFAVLVLIVLLLARSGRPIATVDTAADGPPRHLLSRDDTAVRVAIPPKVQPGPRAFSVTNLLAEMADES